MHPIRSWLIGNICWRWCQWNSSSWPRFSLAQTIFLSQMQRRPLVARLCSCLLRPSAPGSFSPSSPLSTLRCCSPTSSKSLLESIPIHHSSNQSDNRSFSKSRLAIAVAWITAIAMVAAILCQSQVDDRFWLGALPRCLWSADKLGANSRFQHRLIWLKTN